MKKSILVIEDSPTQALSLQALLEANGLHVTVAYNGVDGLALARNLLPEAIVLDIQLPDMDGFQVCQQLKSWPETADLPVIMLTQHDEHTAVVQGLQLGALEYIPKDAFANSVLVGTLSQMGLITGPPVLPHFDDDWTWV
ncbi:MAG TPA: response regulator [Anaerolineae bacterium]|nr:response regulator [Anaerolineae bacterium]HQK12829.1 response regulator [Anaerolineae bacterium]